MRADRFRITPGAAHTIDGIRRVRFLPNRRIDLVSVDESTRLTANMMAEMHDDPARDIQGGPEEPVDAGNGQAPSDDLDFEGEVDG